MATKPNIADTRFGVDGSDADAANFTAPLSGDRDTGWVLNQIPSSAVMTYLQNKAYRWFQYLNAGILSGAHTFDSTVQTGNTLTVGGMALSFTNFTFTADNTTDQLAHTAHGMQTGDGPVRLSNSGGALPTGLATATDYWLILVDPDHVKIATSLANALAGTAINFTTNGTGTHTLLHQAGTLRAADAHVTRNLTVDGGATVTGNLFIGRERHGTRTIRFPAGIGFPQNNSSSWGVAGGGGVDGVPLSQWQIPFVLPDGKRITAVRGRIKDSATGPTKVQMSLSEGTDDTDTGFGTPVLSAGTGAWQTLPMTGLTKVVTAGSIYYALFINTTGTNLIRIAWAEVDFDDLA